YLHRMAKKAEQYRALHEEIRTLDLALSAAQWRQLSVMMAGLEADLARGQAEQQQTVGELARLEDERREKRSQQGARGEAPARRRQRPPTTRRSLKPWSARRTIP